MESSRRNPMACAAAGYSPQAQAASARAAEHPLMETLEDGLRASVQEWDRGDRARPDDATQAKSVTFQVPAEPAHQHKVLDRSSGGASTASVATTASCSSSSSSSSRSDCTWMYYGGMCARQQPEDVMLCPGCRRQTFDRTDATTSKRTCHNGKWKWNGEPPFCCLCASFKGLGRLSQLGCEGCKVRRKCFYKRTSWLNSGCRHCGQQRTQHDGDGELAYPRCPGTASPAPSPNTSQHGKQE